jgi:RsiW-degrading membrane proteinase PrsW (M82 family)
MTDLSTPPPPPMYPPFPPPPLAVVSKPPRKWLGPAGGWIVFLVLTGFWGANLLFNGLVIHHAGFSPNTMILGGLGMTGGVLYTMAYRLRPQDEITPLRLILVFVLGGLLATELAVFLEAIVDLVPPIPVAARSLLVRSLAGIIEEACKLLVVVLFARGLTQRTPRAGLFLGGAVGLGFAAFEDMKYALAIFNQPIYPHNPVGSLVVVTLGRDAIGPFEHPIFSALLAAALFSATRAGRFRITPMVVGVYLLVSAGHGLIDSAGTLLFDVLHNRAAASALDFLVSILVALTGSIIWFRYSRRLKRELVASEPIP